MLVSNGLASTLGGCCGAGLLQEKFLSHVASNPQAVAVLCDGKAYTYAELDSKARTVACQLHASGRRPGERIAILAERGPELIWSVLGVLRLGGVFAILDSAYPAGRLKNLLEVVVPDGLFAAGQDALRTQAAELGAACRVAVAEIDDHLSPLDPVGFAFDQATADAPAYFIFTSGSTGRPKAVACSHVPLRHFIDWHEATFGFTTEDRFSMLSGLSHDPLLRDIFTPLSLGASLVIPRQGVITQPGTLRVWSAQVGATVMHLTPAMGQLLAAGARAPQLPALRQMFWGGDKLAPKLLVEIAAFAPAARHVNFYGCSETPQAAAYYCYTGGTDWPNVPIGRGTEGFTLRVVDAQRREVPPGDSGEIAITSRFLSLGYVENGEIRAPYDGADLTYYTGDIGYYLPDGNIMLLGRGDDQIKIRGFRVELAEVTNAVLAAPCVLSGIALALKKEAQTTIGAFIAVSTEGMDCELAVRALLAERLPSYMLPERLWIFAEHLPLLPNGKIDRQELLDHAQRELAIPTATISKELGNALSEAEAALVTSWEDVFSGVRVTVHDSFASLGGDSLSYVNAYLAAESVLGSVPQGWVGMSVGRLAASQARKSRWVSSIDSFMVLRAVAITLIVAYHFNLTRWGDGFTGALFVVSGFLFGGMQLKEIFNGRSVTSILVSARHILVPTVFFVALTCVIDLAQRHFPPLSTIFLSVDLVGNPADFARMRHELIFWYVDALMQILLLFFVFVSCLPPRMRTQDYIIRFSVGVFIVGCMVKFGVPVFMDHGFLQRGAAELSLEQLSPIGNFSTVALGILLAIVPGRHKYALLGVALIYAGLDAHFYGMINGISIAGAAFLLTTWKRVVLPRVLASLAFTISGASLFIYLSHLLFGYGTNKLFHGQFLLLQVGIALLGGVGVQRLWRGVSHRLIRSGWRIGWPVHGQRLGWPARAMRMGHPNVAERSN